MQNIRSTSLIIQIGKLQKEPTNQLAYEKKTTTICI